MEQRELVAHGHERPGIAAVIGPAALVPGACHPATPQGKQITD